MHLVVILFFLLFNVLHYKLRAAFRPTLLSQASTLPSPPATAYSNVSKVLFTLKPAVLQVQECLEDHLEESGFSADCKEELDNIIEKVWAEVWTDAGQAGRGARRWTLSILIPPNTGGRVRKAKPLTRLLSKQRANKFKLDTMRDAVQRPCMKAFAYQ